MKRLLLSAIILLVCISTFANLDKYGSYKLYHPEKGIYDVTYWNANVNDTIINEYTYCWVSAHTYAIREDDSKVFMYNCETQKEILVLDMGLQEGNNITMPNGEEMTVVEVKDIVLTANSWLGEQRITRKGIYLQGIKNPNNTDIWIDSIGSITYGLFPEEDYENQKLLSYNDYIITFNDGNVRNFAVSKGVSLPENSDSPMPRNDIFTNITFQNWTLEISGYLYDDSAGDWDIFVEEKEKVLNIYYYNMPPFCDSRRLSAFNIRIPGLAQDNYEIYWWGHPKKYLGSITNGEFHSLEKNKVDDKNFRAYIYNSTLIIEFPSVGAGEAITLYDATGRVVATQAVRPGATTATIDVATLPSGVYIARMGNGATSKIVI
ncbi:MAG: T9SS type A sorting domain-containing protein [Bacteroidaceae bacterium]|nr:T9SS type A sorting domain-containing protein [Bacteroidaceae bacterium]